MIDNTIVIKDQKKRKICTCNQFKEGKNSEGSSSCILVKKRRIKEIGKGKKVKALKVKYN